MTISLSARRGRASLKSVQSGSRRVLKREIANLRVMRFPFERLARPGDGKGMRSTKRAVFFADPRALQAFASPSQAFPKLGPFSPNISKDSFVRFV
ncbi:MAG: hypothetical protein ABSC22_13895 [Roseiarcus sp.]|jgi:hypothetical protein